jgi:hypothetical protein
LQDGIIRGLGAWPQALADLSLSQSISLRDETSMAVGRLTKRSRVVAGLGNPVSVGTALRLRDAVCPVSHIIDLLVGKAKEGLDGFLRMPRGRCGLMGGEWRGVDMM